MYFVLVSFKRKETDERRYVIFPCINDEYAFVFSPLYRNIIDSGNYTWSSVVLPKEVALKTGFDIVDAVYSSIGG